MLQHQAQFGLNPALIFSIKKIMNGKASITDKKPPEDNGIFTTETAQDEAYYSRAEA